MANTHISKDNFLQASTDIDVNEIMENIRKDIEDKKNRGVLREQDILEIQHLELQPLPDYEEIPNVYKNHLYPVKENLEANTKNNQENLASPQETNKVNKVTNKIFSPKNIIKKFIRKFLKPLIEKILGISVQYNNDRFNECYSKLTVNENEIIVLNQKDTLHQDYIKLLHNALNNMITESTKLKVEELSLKTRMKNLEDKIAFIEKRQRAIEKRQFNQ